MEKIGYAEPAKPSDKMSLDSIVRRLVACLSELSADVTSASERIHGTLCGSGVGGPPLVQGWADDLRSEAQSALLRGQDAQNDLSRIRETLGL